MDESDVVDMLCEGLEMLLDASFTDDEYKDEIESYNGFRDEGVVS